MEEDVELSDDADEVELAAGDVEGVVESDDVTGGATTVGIVVDLGSLVGIKVKPCDNCLEVG